MWELRPQASLLLQINPLLKMAVGIGLTGFALSPANLGTTALYALVPLVLLLVSVRVPPRTLLGAGVALAGFTLLSIWLVGSPAAALGNTLRLLAILVPVPLLTATTPASDLVRALQAVRLPAFLVLGLTLTWRFLPLIQLEAGRIVEANRLRGTELSREPARWFSGLFVPLIFRIVSYADEVTIGLETRGYDPDAPRSQSTPLRWGTPDTGFTLGSLLLVVAAEGLKWTG